MFEGAGLDGLIAKPADLTYQPDKRVMSKIKHERTADCVVAGFRVHKSGPVVGSLLLGLFDDRGVLHLVGVSARVHRRPPARSCSTEMQPLRSRTFDGHPWNWAAQEHGEQTQRVPDETSRWNGGRTCPGYRCGRSACSRCATTAWRAIRFRHTTQFVRWRPDRDPGSCTYDQLDRPVQLQPGRRAAAADAHAIRRHPVTGRP